MILFVSGIALPTIYAAGTTRIQPGVMRRMLIIRSIKVLKPLLSLKDVFGARKAIKVVRLGPPGKRLNQELSAVTVRAANLCKQPKPRVLLLTVEDAGLVRELRNSLG